MSLIERANKILIKNNKSPLIIKRNIPDIDNYNFCLYRFLDEEGKVIYLGKCTRSVNSDKRGYTKNYFLNERLKHHFAPSSKQNPKSLYLNVAKIEILLPNVSSNEELEKLENSLISYYEREHLCCHYNREILNPIYIGRDENEWLEYYRLTDSDKITLMNNYGYEEIPPIEITNERLRAMLWLKENNKLKEIENEQ